MTNILAKNLDIAYGDKIIVEDLNIEIPKGEITIIVGPNGCGKSTILKALGRIIGHKRGDIFLNDKNIRSMSNKEIAKNLAILPQSPKTPEGVTVYNLVSYGRFPHEATKKNKNKDEEIINWALKETGLLEFKDMEVGSLSGGQRQRAWIAMALVQDTEMIFLDEPTTYLDLTYQLEILELLNKLNEKNKTTIVMVLHDINLSCRFAHNIFAVKSGKIKYSGRPENIMTKKVLEDIFSIDATIVKDPNTNKLVCISYNLLKEEVS